MVVGVMQFELHIPGARSLKDKRRVVKGLKDRLHRHHMVSVAEIEALDHPRIAMMGLTMTSNAVAPVLRTLDRIAAHLSALPDARLDSVTREILDADALPEPPGRAPLWTDAERRPDPEYTTP